MSPLTAGQLAPLFHFPGVLLLLSSSARVHRPGAFLVRVLRVGGELKRRRRDHGAEVRESPKPHSAPFVFCLPACLQRRRRSFPSSAQLRQRSRTPARARRRRQKSDDELTVGCFPPPDSAPRRCTSATRAAPCSRATRATPRRRGAPRRRAPRRTATATATDTDTRATAAAARTASAGAAGPAAGSGPRRRTAGASIAMRCSTSWRARTTRRWRAFWAR